MDSIWFQVDDTESETDESGHYMGVFNQRPEQIAAWLPRPQTPFNFSSTNYKSINRNKDEMFCHHIQRADSEPEVISFKAFIEERDSISVF
ncbi:hypothetical protein TVAG_192040 [Trichomonas vaginalis G3]|uniref:Uncharacterized protein n=1 Tax=Trichomonas vaginalis (strain ATCC PRA-98 / G3) TaxID=412133 RepID=A2ETV0_TRIV3|nr:hypothetical protein TVAGG3_0892490 [Trichomonas vaginalis G3]EAY03905.1 hypothetical protein TVAG_192040 [Trichomonas vaginalis G3]KAI5502818.1 hypothetical protein TVAGG3_0892490 [Trichomonas vaginalis G3]|eukprot:XP_001316128.1 hypothetical protein [Trichomonas vaginalis G3]